MSSIEDNSLKIQTVADGDGPIYHRIYSLNLNLDFGIAEEVMDIMKADINAFSPALIAVFEKTAGENQRLDVGDEFHVKFALPVDAPVRVTAIHDNSFKLATLMNHIEAGEISFSILQHTGSFEFKIESVARSRDSVIDFFYDKVPSMRTAQSTMWQLMCQNFAKACFAKADSNTPIPDVSVLSEKWDGPAQKWILI